MNLESPLWRRCYLHLRWYFMILLLIDVGIFTRSTVHWWHFHSVYCNSPLVACIWHPKCKVFVLDLLREKLQNDNLFEYSYKQVFQVGSNPSVLLWWYFCLESFLAKNLRKPKRPAPTLLKKKSCSHIEKQQTVSRLRLTSASIKNSDSVGWKGSSGKKCDILAHWAEYLISGWTFLYLDWISFL